MARKYFRRKYLSFLIVVIFILLTFQPLFGLKNCIGNEMYSEKDKTEQFLSTDKSYGLIIPLIYGDNLPYTSIQQSITNMINDLLRLDMPVFWASMNFSALTRTLSNDTTITRFFERGTYIVPFTENSSTNALIISVATDYELDSEIETYYPVKMYFVMEPLSVSTYPMHYAKCAMRVGLDFVYGFICLYSDILYSSGFLDIQYLFDDEISQKLDNKDFNVIIWPGGEPPDLMSSAKAADLNICTAIRSFVNNGGGYVGTCYGATSSSSGLFLPIYLIQNFKRNLPTIGFLSLTSSSAMLMACAAFVSIELVNHSHPVSFGLDTIQESFHIGGPVFMWTNMSQNTQVVGVLKDLQVGWWRNRRIEKMSPQRIDTYLSLRKGKPIWISSNFGKGKVVDFGCHPEMHFPNRQDRVIDNAFFYVTSDINTTVQVSDPVLFSEILTLSSITSKIVLPDCHGIFNEIWSETHSMNNTTKGIDETIRNTTIQYFNIKEKWKGGEAISSHPPYYSYYQYSLDVFLKALITLEKVYNLTKNNTDISAAIATWRNKTNSALNDLAGSFLRLIDNNTVLLSRMKNYIGSPVEKSHLLNLINTVEKQCRKIDNLLNQLESSTVKLYRKCWYTYESEQSQSAFATENVSEIHVRVTNKRSPSIDVDTNTRTIYVDDDAYIGGDGSSDHPYQHIQDAIDASSNGDSIYVHTGVYDEHLYIGKSIRLIGEDKNSTVIDGHCKPVHLISTTTSDIEITHFTIRNSSNLFCGVCLYSSNNTIQGNIFINNGIGLGLYPLSSNNTIIDNLFTQNTCFGTGIDTITQRNNLLEKNIFIDNNIGLYIVNAYNIIRQNRFFNDGLYFAGSSDPLVVEISDNTINGKPFVCYKNLMNFTITEAGGILLSNCSYGVIDHVNISNTETGIDICTSSYITITHCDIASGIVGISLQSSEDITIVHNHIMNNSWFALWINSSKKNHLLQNFLTHNDGGIYLYGSDSNTITHNNITDNLVGISCWSSSESNNMLENNLINTQENAFDKCHNLWNKNYWNDWIGLDSNILKFLPYHVKGRILLNFDRQPAKEPYDISILP